MTVDTFGINLTEWMDAALFPTFGVKDFIFHYHYCLSNNKIKAFLMNLRCSKAVEKGSLEK